MYLVFFWQWFLLIDLHSEIYALVDTDKKKNSVNLLCTFPKMFYPLWLSGHWKCAYLFCDETIVWHDNFLKIGIVNQAITLIPCHGFSQLLLGN